MRSNNKYYTLIGSRKTPEFIINIMQQLAICLENENWVVRSGNASGADQCANIVRENNREIYVPWKHFKPLLKDEINIQNLNNFKESKLFVDKYHPNKNLKEVSYLLLQRDIYQILGQDLKTPSKFVVCWTSDGAKTFNEITKATGGTGMALRIANINKIPVFNLQNENDLSKIKEYIKKRNII